MTDNIVASKYCPKCDSIKETWFFHKNRRSKDGLAFVCKKCAIKTTGEWQKKNHVTVLARIAEWKKSNPEKVAKYRAAELLNRTKRSSETLRIQTLSRKGLTPEGFEELFASQNGVCGICQKPDAGIKRFAIDHRHGCCPDRKACEKCRRGLLCGNCNTALNRMEEIEDWHLKALAYLQKFAVRENTDGRRAEGPAAS
jgi:hypothetical protein